MIIMLERCVGLAYQETKRNIGTQTRVVQEETA